MRIFASLVLLLFSTTFVFAQENSQRVLVPDQPVDGTIDEANPIQIYNFDATVGDIITLTLTGQSSFPLTLVLADAQGETLAQTAGTVDETQVAIEDFLISVSGKYYVMVFPRPGLEAPLTGNFILTLDSGVDVDAADAPAVAATEAPATDTDTETTAPPQNFQIGQVILNNGINVDLTWNTQDDLNLQIRDPSGGTLFWDSRTTNDGGAFGPDVNGLCEVLTEPPAVETASWPGGALTTGSYEVLVYYRQACVGNSPVDFTVDVTVDGNPLEPIQGTLLPPVNNNANVFISSFTVNSDGTASTGDSGPYIDTRTLDVPAQELLSRDATPVIRDVAQTGTITNAEPYETYTYEGLSGEIISLEMTAITGSLDTLLLVLDSSGNVIAGNDDREAVVNTNSAITSLRLPTEGVYTVVATRYGKLVGGTEGNYELLISGSNIPTELLELNLPDGDIEITLTWDTNADLQLLVRDPSGDSVYDDVPTIPSGGRITAQGNINCTVTENSTPVSYIYWPDGFLRIGSYEIEVWFQSECNDTRPVFFTLYIVVEGELIFTDTIGIQFNERYLTSFSIDQTGIATPSNGGIIGGSETLDYPSELASAVQIEPGQTVPGSITPDDKFDLYTFTGQAGDLVTIDMRATSNTLDTLLFLIDPSGIEIATNDDSNETTNSLIPSLLLSQDGEYTIIATHYGAIYGGTTGGYNLNLRIDR